MEAFQIVSDWSWDAV